MTESELRDRIIEYIQKYRTKASFIVGAGAWIELQNLVAITRTQGGLDYYGVAEFSLCFSLPTYAIAEEPPNEPYQRGVKK
jgi:hypothetical protein